MALKNLLRVLPTEQKGVAPNAETQYLTSLIAELESRKGVLEYVELAVRTEASKQTEIMRPPPEGGNEWAIGFSLLVEQHSVTIQPETLPQKDNIAHRIHLNSISEAVEKYPRFVLVGEPGAGKTTVIRRLALEAARKRLNHPRTAPLPVLLYLPLWDQELTPLDFVCKNWPFEDDPTSLLTQGDILLYLDGLNEMGVAGIEKIQKLRLWFESEDTPKHVIVTCRIGDYAGDLKFTNMPVVLAEEMNELKIREFAEKYLGEKSRDFLNRILPEDNRDHGNSRSLFRLAKNPYLLAALIFVFEQSPIGELPRNNGALMRAPAKALWERERQKQTPGWIPFKDIEEKLGHLAFAMIDEGKPIDVEVEYALKFVGNEVLLKIGRSASLVEIRGLEVRFYHQLMQEYFAAAQLGYSHWQKKIGKRYSLFSRDLCSEKWDPVAIALSGISYDPDTIISEISLSDPFLAHECLSSGVTVSSATLQKVAGSFINMWDVYIIEYDTPYYTADILVGFGKDIIPELEKALDSQDSQIRWLATWTISRIADASSTPILVRCLLDKGEQHFIKGPRVCDIAAEALTNIATPEALAAVEQWQAEQEQK